MYCVQDLQLGRPVKVGLMCCLQDLQLGWPVNIGLMYCLQDLQLGWPVKVGLMSCLQDLQLGWPVQIGLMYCLQDLQLSWPVKVGLMYCLQDLQLSWPNKAVWRERSVLTGFNISAITKLQVLRTGVWLCDITPQNTAVQLQTAMMLQYSTFPVRLPVNCNWWSNPYDLWSNLSSDSNERFCCCIATAAQIERYKAVMPADTTRDTLPPASIQQTLGYSQRKLRSQSANTQWGRSGLQRPDSDWDTSCCSFVTAKAWEGFSCTWYIWQRCVNQQEWWYVGTEECH
jgi:hypothetical protein